MVPRTSSRPYGLELVRGETVGDFLNISGKKPNVHAVVGVDKENFVDLIVEACRKFDGWEVHIDE